MWTKIIEILLSKMLERPTPKTLLTKAAGRLYREMAACHDAYETYKQATAATYSNWLQKRDTGVDEFSARWKYWEHSFTVVGKWGAAIEALADTLYDLKEVFGIFDPDVYDVISNYVEQEAYAYDFHRRLTPATDGKKVILIHSLAQHMPGNKIADPAAVVENQERDAADFSVAIEELRKFLLEKLKLSPEEIFAAR